MSSIAISIPHGLIDGSSESSTIGRFMEVIRLGADLATNIEKVHLVNTSETENLEIPKLVDREVWKEDFGSENGSWIGEFTKQLNEIAQLEDNWNGQGVVRPNKIAIHAAEEILAVLHEVNLSPTQIAPSVEEGVTLSFHENNRYGIIESYNSGEVCAAIYRSDKEPLVWQMGTSIGEIKEASQFINVFLNA